ncbi:MAG: sensor histidine kinase [Candidatus Hodarchaeota archaeon]
MLLLNLNVTFNLYREDENMACPNEPVMIWNPLERFLWGTAFIIAIMCGLYFIHIARKREVFNERIIMLGLASLPLGFAISLFFTFFQVLQLEVIEFNNFFFCGFYSDTADYEFFGTLSYILVGLAGMIFALAFEIIIKRTKFLLTTGFIIIIIIIIIIEILSLDYDLTRGIFNIFLFPALIILVPFILYLYTKWSHLEFKAVSSFLLFGFILFMISLVLAERAHKKIDVYPLELSPILFMLGCCIIILPIIINPKIISRALTYWLSFAILTFPILIALIFIDIVEGIPEGFNPLFIIMFFIAFFYILFLFLLIIRDIKSEIVSVSQETHEADEDFKADFLAMFTRPQEVNFLASISHELKTPLTSIIGFANTILKGRTGEINKEQEKQLNIILNSANHLHELINDVIDIAKIEIDKLNVRKQRFDLINELAILKDTFDVAIKEKELEMFMDTPEHLTIYNDKKRINQILLNLIGNAVKFTDKGIITIKVRTSKREIVISVKDTGLGIQKEDIKKLFKPFSRIDESGKFEEGSGLGLHLSKKLANLLGGDILVKSKFGKGSTFKLLLNVEEEEITN